MQDSNFFSIWLRQKRLINLIACHLSAIDGVCVCTCAAEHGRNTTWNSFKRLIDIDAPIGWRTPNYVISPRFNENRNWFSLSLSLFLFFFLSFVFLVPFFCLGYGFFPSIFLFRRLIFHARDRIVSPNMGIQISGIRIYYAWLRFSVVEHSHCTPLNTFLLKMCTCRVYLRLFFGSCTPFSNHFNL